LEKGKMEKSVPGIQSLLSILWSLANVKGDNKAGGDAKR
jgi:hypothetical protein